MHLITQYPITQAVWIATILAQALVCLLMGVNGSGKNYPRFFTYSLFGVLNSVALLGLVRVGRYDFYFWGYWSLGLLSSILGLLVIKEVFVAAMRPLEGLRDLSSLAFRWAACLMAIVALIVTLNSRSGGSNSVLVGVTNFESSVKLMQVGLLLMLFTFSKRIGLSVKSRTFNNKMGLGVTAAVNMFALSLLPHLTESGQGVLNLLRGLAFLSSCLVWVTYFALPVTEEKPVIVPIASPLMRWNEIAAAIGHPAGRVMYVNGSSAEPFLPRIERIVDDVLRKQQIQ